MGLKFLKSKTGLAVTAAVLIGLPLLAVVSWSAHRFNEPDICTACHEVYVTSGDDEPSGELSQSLEDYNPSKPVETGLFQVTVGCGECHAYPYEEYRESAHFENDREVQPGCIGCHPPHSVREILNWKFFYINKGTFGESPFHAISNGMRDIPAWEELRIKLAKRVREQMVAEDSIMCKNCHKEEAKIFLKNPQHQNMKKTCVQCHYNIVHKDVKWHETAKKAE